jgi:hypothetical protein
MRFERRFPDLKPSVIERHFPFVKYLRLSIVGVTYYLACKLGNVQCSLAVEVWLWCSIMIGCASYLKSTCLLSEGIFAKAYGEY